MSSHLPKASQAMAKSTILAIPFHIVFTPGGFAPFLLTYPPSFATIIINSPNAGGFLGRVFLLFAILYTDFHSASSNTSLC